MVRQYDDTIQYCALQKCTQFYAFILQKIIATVVNETKTHTKIRFFFTEIAKAFLGKNCLKIY